MRIFVKSINRNFCFVLGLVFSLCIVSAMSAMEQEPPVQKFRSMLENINNKAWQHFKHDPEIEIWRNAPEDAREAVVVIHGFGGNKNDALFFTSPDTSACYVRFNFSDVRLRLWRTSLGQLPDVLQAAYVVKACHDAGFEKISLWAMSRGGAVAKNLCWALANNHYNDAFEKIGITAGDKIKILEKIQKGCLILNVPLADSNKAIKGVGGFFWHADNFLRSLGSFMYAKNPRLYDFFKKRVGPMGCVRSLFAEIASNHAVNGMQGLRSIKNLCESGIKFNVVMLMQNRDTMVPNDAIIECYKELYSRNSEHTFFVLENGCHITPPTEKFFNVVRAARKKWGLGDADISYVLAQAQPKSGESPEDFITRLGTDL
jgi:hypothetical protein